MDLGSSNPLHSFLSITPVCDPIVLKTIGVMGLSQADAFSEKMAGRMVTLEEAQAYFTKMKDTYLFHPNTKGKGSSGDSDITGYPVDGKTTVEC